MICRQFTSGDRRAKTLFGTPAINTLSFNSIIGTATCTDTVKSIYSTLAFGNPCEAYLNIYDVKGKPVSSFLSFRISNVSTSSTYSSKMVCGVLNIAPASVPGNITFLSSTIA